MPLLPRQSQQDQALRFGARGEDEDVGGRVAIRQCAAAIEIEPGICRLRRGTAFLASGDEYHPVLHVGVLTQTDWDRLVEEWINDPGLAIDIAAGVLPDELFTPRPVAATAFDPAERMAAVSHIIPTVDEIGVECDCGSTARACRHLRELAAALVAAVDEDAWTLIALRGCTPDEIVGRATAHLGFQPDADQPRFVDAAELWADGAFGCEPPPALRSALADAGQVRR